MRLRRARRSESPGRVLSWWLRAIARLPLRVLERAIWLLRIRLAPRARVHGLLVADLRPDATKLDPQLVAKLEEALRILEYAAPARARRLREDVERILIRDIPGVAGQYWHLLGAVVINHDYLARRGNAWVALTLVHEATHARLRFAGFGYGPDVRQRIERVCTRAEIHVAERLPDSAPVLAQLAARLDRPAFTDAELRELRAREAEAAGAPRWLVRLLRR